MTVLDTSAIASWRREPVRFIEQVLHNPETDRPFELFDAERQFFAHCWQPDDNGRALYPEQCFAAPKKSAKTALAGIHLLATTCLFGGRYSEAYAIANDLEQAQSRVFQAARRIVESSPLLAREAEITQQRISFPQTGAVIQAIGSDYAGAAGANPVISSFDELWGYTSERSFRLWDEMVPVPTRKFSCRLTTTYAGFEGESKLLEQLYKRGLEQPEIGPSLHAGDGLLMFWTHQPIAPWQDERWLSEMRRSLRPNQYLRMIENRFVATESSFIDMRAWDRCVDPRLAPLVANKVLPIYVGVDASTKHDSTAIVAVNWDRKAQMVRLVYHRVFQPSPEEPLDFEQTIETTLLDLHKRFAIRQVLFDPWQMAAVSQRLLKRGLKIEEFPQNSPNLTAASQNLYELIEAGSLAVYPTPDIRLAISRAVAIETPRGWRIGKDKQAHKIDVVVALAMAAYAAVKGGGQPYYNLSAMADGDDEDTTQAEREAQEAREHNRALAQQIYSYSGGRYWPL